MKSYSGRGRDSAKTGGKDRPVKLPEHRAHFREYLRWLKPYKGSAALLLSLASAASVLQMADPLFLRSIIDRILLNRSFDGTSRIAELTLWGCFYLVFISLSNLVGAARDYRLRLLNTDLLVALRHALFERMLHLPLSKLWDMKTGGILSRLIGDVESTTGLLQTIMVSVMASLRVLIAIVVLMTLNWRLATAAMVMLSGMMVACFIFARRVRPIYLSLRRDAELIDGRAGEAFSGIRVVRAFRRERSEVLEYVRSRHTVRRKELFAQRRELLVMTPWSMLTGIINVMVVWYGGVLYVRGAVSIGDIMAFQWYMLLLVNPIWGIVNSASDLQRSLASIERVFDLLSMEDEDHAHPGSIDAPQVVAEIRFEHVEFEYRPGLPVIRDFCVSVPGGSVVALVGRSGAGKSTITDLVARFHEPTRGRILLNGVDVHDLRLRSYRGLLAVVHQDVFLFDGSVHQNIAYGRQDASDAEIEDAARRANAHEFVTRLPEGYETLIGERGVKLSGGQQQRLAIARAILAAPQILILDEATSNLDTESEQLIQESMATLLEGRTTFVIAHRLSTVRRADMILLMDDGRIVERGSHEHLMASRGVYYQMVMRQVDSLGYSEYRAL